MTCDVRFPGIVDRVATLLDQVRGRGATAARVPAPGCVVVNAYWKHWPCLFPQHGPGRKHERTLTLEPWQQEILADHPGPFVRGLFHSDGARVANWASRTRDGVTRRYDYPRWQFVNHSPEIRQWCTQALDRLGVPWRASRWQTISVSRREGVSLVDEIVGPKA